MWIVDSALKKREAENRPVRVGIVGAGFMGRNTAFQIIRHTPGMRVAAVANRTIAQAYKAYADAGLEAKEAASVHAIEDCVRAGRPVVCQDGRLLSQADGIDIVFECTGAIDFGAEVWQQAFDHGKNVVHMNAELEGTLGPILARKAKQAGVILSGCEGDQPGLEVNLHRYVSAMGLRPLVMGNCKGLQDPYRTPTTQKSFAEKWGQKPEMVTSFADGTKMMFEQAVVANALGFRVPKRGLNGFAVDCHFDDLVKLYDVEQLKASGGIVDYVVGARPPGGVFCLAHTDHPQQKHMLNLYKLGPGPLYDFYVPYHICHFEAPFSIARVALFGDSVMTPVAPFVDVIAQAKRDLKAGEILDGIGHYMTYGVCENSDIVARDRLLPIGLAEGCKLRRHVTKDSALSYDDVDLPPNRLCDRLRAEQDRAFESRFASR